jgi:hypothetical protein
MVGLDGKRSTGLVVELIRGALRVNDAALNVVATELVARLGAALVPDLVADLAARRTRPAHRARPLGALGRVADELELDDVMPVLQFV